MIGVIHGGKMILRDINKRICVIIMALCLGIIALSGCGSESPAGENEIEIPWEDGSDLSVAEEAMKEVAGEDGTLKEEAKENGNAGQAGDTDVPEAADTPAQAAVPEWDGDFEAFWIAYWDGEDYIKKLQDRGYGADIFCMFEAMFDGEYKLYLEDSVKEQYDAVKAKAKDKKYYLTFVNDVVTETGSEQKDTDVLYAVLKDPAGHAGDVVKLAKDNGFDGVEIDYEKIRKDLGLWDLFIAFENELIKQASDAGLEVRIVLESSTPVSQISLPKGPEYVVMCYNLYGYGTEPGPKADRGFLEDIVRDFDPLSDNLGYAFANGGFDWNLTKDGITALSDREAKELIIKHQGDGPERDMESGVVKFTYEEKGEKHEVWVADDATIQFWADVIAVSSGKKVRVSLWRV